MECRNGKSNCHAISVCSFFLFIHSNSIHLNSVSVESNLNKKCKQCTKSVPNTHSVWTNIKKHMKMFKMFKKSRAYSSLISECYIATQKNIHSYTYAHTFNQKITQSLAFVCSFSVHFLSLKNKEPANLIQDKMQSMHLKLSWFCHILVSNTSTLGEALRQNIEIVSTMSICRCKKRIITKHYYRADNE